jgi:hypothetical protein
VSGLVRSVRESGAVRTVGAPATPLSEICARAASHGAGLR